MCVSVCIIHRAGGKLLLLTAFERTVHSAMQCVEKERDKGHIVHRAQRSKCVQLNLYEHVQVLVHVHVHMCMHYD